MTAPSSSPAHPQPAILIQRLGKMYRLYDRSADKVLDALGLNRLFFWRRQYYQAFWALRDLNLEVARGERLGIIGRNGAGKSTLLKLIIGNLTPTEGTLRVYGHVQALMELGTGFHPEFTGRQNIRASLAYQGLKAAEIEAKLAEIIDFAELGDFIDQPLKTYSAGMQARLGFSTATSIEPDILIVDEVLGAGDAYFANKCLERMRLLTEKADATVLFVSHDLGSIQQMCTRVIWIDRGRIVADGTPLEVTKSYYASILLQEERRLRARNDRRGGTAPGAAPPIELMGRLIIAGERLPRSSHPVRRLTLTDGADLKLTIEPGAPMDNDRGHPAYLMTDPAYMCWGEPRLLLDSRVRCLENTGGRYRHAPFVFMLPVGLGSVETLSLQVEHAAQTNEEVRVEIFDGQAYRLLGTLQPSPNHWLAQAWTLPDDIGPQRMTRQPDAAAAAGAAIVREAAQGEIVLQQKSTDRFYSICADLQRLTIQDQNGQPASVFRLDEPVYFAVEVDVFQPLTQASCVISVYTLNGNVAANLHWPIKQGLKPGRHRWRVALTTPNLRQGEYLISCGVAKEFITTTNEVMVFYCLWSRAVSFRVDEGHLGNTPLGIVRMDTYPPVGCPLTTIAISDDGAPA